MDFPLFKRSCESEPGQSGESGLSSNHHPFTAPRLEDIPLLETNPLQVRADHFDLVVNGVEVGGGSARIHDPMLQEHILKDIIKVRIHIQIFWYVPETYWNRFLNGSSLNLTTC